MYRVIGHYLIALAAGCDDAAMCCGQGLPAKPTGFSMIQRCSAGCQLRRASSVSAAGKWFVDELFGAA
jgi:hypothetical protein